MQHEDLVLVNELLHRGDALGAVAGIVFEHGLDLAAVDAALVVDPLVVRVEADLRLAVARRVAGERRHHTDLDGGGRDAVLRRRWQGQRARRSRKKSLHVLPLCHAVTGASFRRAIRSSCCRQLSSGSTSPNFASISKRFHSTAPGTRSPTASRTTIGRKPSARPSHTVSRTHAEAVTPVTTMVSTPAARRKPAR